MEVLSSLLAKINSGKRKVEEAGYFLRPYADKKVLAYGMLPAVGIGASLLLGTFSGGEALAYHSGDHPLTIQTDKEFYYGYDTVKIELENGEPRGKYWIHMGSDNHVSQNPVNKIVADESGFGSASLKINPRMPEGCYKIVAARNGDFVSTGICYSPNVYSV